MTATIIALLEAATALNKSIGAIVEQLASSSTESLDRLDEYITKWKLSIKDINLVHRRQRESLDE